DIKIGKSAGLDRREVIAPPYDCIDVACRQPQHTQVRKRRNTLWAELRSSGIGWVASYVCIQQSCFIIDGISIAADAIGIVRLRCVRQGGVPGRERYRTIAGKNNPVRRAKGTDWSGISW